MLIIYFCTAQSLELSRFNINDQAKHCAHLTNINSDPSLTGSLKYLLLFEDKTRQLIVGASDKADIQIAGLGMLDQHARLTFENKTYFLEPFTDARVICNGKRYEEKVDLSRITLIKLNVKNITLLRV